MAYAQQQQQQQQKQGTRGRMGYKRAQVQMNKRGIQTPQGGMNKQVLGDMNEGGGVGMNECGYKQMQGVQMWGGMNVAGAAAGAMHPLSPSPSSLTTNFLFYFILFLHFFMYV
jgi:hypothetical protein